MPEWLIITLLIIVAFFTSLSVWSGVRYFLGMSIDKSEMFAIKYLKTMTLLSLIYLFVFVFLMYGEMYHLQYLEEDILVNWFIPTGIVSLLLCKLLPKGIWEYSYDQWSDFSKKLIPILLVIALIFLLPWLVNMWRQN